MINKIARKDIWVIIPGINEEKYLARVLKKVLKETKNIVFIDDGSSDKTVAIAKKYLKHVLVHSINLGKGSALKTGCEYAFNYLNAKAVIFMDSDDQHDSQEIPLFVKQLQFFDVVFGIRTFDNKMPLIRIMMNRLASFVIYLLFGSYIPDIPSGYKALTKKAYKKIKWNASGYEVEMEIASRTAKYKVPFTTVIIKTIYHDLNRGMTIIDTMRMLGKIISWRFTL